MYKVFIEMSSGAISKEHEFLEESDAMKLYNRFVQQMRPWYGFQADVVLTHNGKKIQLEQIRNA